MGRPWLTQGPGVPHAKHMVCTFNHFQFALLGPSGDPPPFHPSHSRVGIPMDHQHRTGQLFSRALYVQTFAVRKGVLVKGKRMNKGLACAAVDDLQSIRLLPSLPPGLRENAP